MMKKLTLTEATKFVKKSVKLMDTLNEALADYDWNTHFAVVKMMERLAKEEAEKRTSATPIPDVADEFYHLLYEGIGDIANAVDQASDLPIAQSLCARWLAKQEFSREDWYA